MQEWFDSNVLPILLSGGFLAVLSIVVVPILVRITSSKTKALRQQIDKLNNELARLGGISSAIDDYNKDIQDIKAKNDYTDVIASGINDALAKPMLVMQGHCSDMVNMLKIVHDAQLQSIKAMSLAWGDKVEGVNAVLGDSPTMLELTKKEIEIARYKQAIRELKGSDAESIIASCVGG